MSWIVLSVLSCYGRFMLSWYVICSDANFCCHVVMSLCYVVMLLCGVVLSFYVVMLYVM